MPSRLILQSLPASSPPLTPVRLLLHGNGAADGTVFPDNSSITPTLAFAPSGDITTQDNPDDVTGPNTFSASSIYANGGYLTAGANAGIAIGTDDFSFEFFFYPINANFGFIFDTRDPGSAENSGFFVGYSWPGDSSLDGLISFGSIPGNLDAGYWFHGVTALTLDTWHYIVVSRVSGVAVLAIDGVVVPVFPHYSNPLGAHPSVAFNYNISGTTAAICAQSSTPHYPVKGYLNEIRLSVGVSANPGPTYPVPDAPFPNANV